MQPVTNIELSYETEFRNSVSYEIMPAAGLDDKNSRVQQKALEKMLQFKLLNFSIWNTFVQYPRFFITIPGDPELGMHIGNITLKAKARQIV